jgi:hypothetical protein
MMEPICNGLASQRRKNIAGLATRRGVRVSQIAAPPLSQSMLFVICLTLFLHKFLALLKPALYRSSVRRKI